VHASAAVLRQLKCWLCLLGCLQDFLSAGQVLCIAVDKTGQEEQVVLPEAHTLTNLPLVSTLSVMCSTCLLAAVSATS
jgi:hypothetical protein